MGAEGQLDCRQPVDHPRPSASQVSTSDGSGSVPAPGVPARTSHRSPQRAGGDVYLVMTSGDGTAREGRVLINGEPPTAAERGTDVRAGGYFTVVESGFTTW